MFLFMPETFYSEPQTNGFREFWSRYKPFMSFASPNHLSVVIGDAIPFPIQELWEVPNIAPRILQSIEAHPTKVFCIVPKIHLASGEEKRILTTVSRDNFLKWTESLSLEHRIKRRPILDEKDIEKIHTLFDVSTTFAGGMDNYSTAHNLAGVAILDAIRRNDKPLFNSYDRRLQDEFHISQGVSIIKLRRKLKHINYLFKNYNPKNREELRIIYEHHTGILMSYLVNKITDTLLIPVSQITQNQLNELETIQKALREVNLGSITTDNTTLQANINNAMVYLQELWISRKHPYAYALGNEVVTRKTGLPHQIRFDAALSTELFDGFLNNTGIITHDNKFDGRGDIKSASSLLFEILSNKDNQNIRDRITQLAQQYGVLSEDQKPYPQNATLMDQAIIALSKLDALLIIAEKLKNADQTEVFKLVKDVTEAMNNKEYFIRARAYPTDDYGSLKNSIERAHNITNQYPSDDNVSTHAFIAIDGPNGGWARRFSFQEVIELYDNHPNATLDVLLDAVRQIPDGGSGFGMWFVWLPARLDIKSKKLTLIPPEEFKRISQQERKNILWVETQLCLPENIPPALHNRLFHERRSNEFVPELAHKPLIDFIISLKQKIFASDRRPEYLKDRLPVHFEPPQE